MSLINSMVFLMMIALSENGHTRQEVIDDIRLERILIQQEDIIKNQEKLDRKLEQLVPYQEQVRVNTDRITRLEREHENLESWLRAMTIAVLIALLGIIGHFIYTVKKQP